ncbi:hypothetical protein [Streptomyces sp. NPDC101149]|uniref:hypothetical protein n=1 Tax=Streptomyces sp. NPDC101149 TaxID=3366113 RepID=UPI003808F970
MDDAGRYRLTLTLDGRWVMDGWWWREDTAISQFTGIVGKHGRPGARIILVDTGTGAELHKRPDEV